MASDTDSCVHNTKLITDLGDITIGDLYDQYTTKLTELKQNVDNKKDSVRKLIQPVKSLSYDSDANELVYNNITYIMKHKVNKRMYRIKSNDSDNYVDVTEDHSVIIKRGNNTLSVKPVDIIKGDQIIEVIL